MNNARPLKITNENNKLCCTGFIQIHFAPPEGTVLEKDFEQIYVIKKDDEDVFVKLVGFARVHFQFIGTVVTITACGLESDDWKKMWLEKYPETKPETEMAVYCYQRLK